MTAIHLPPEEARRHPMIHGGRVAKAAIDGPRGSSQTMRDGSSPTSQALFLAISLSRSRSEAILAVPERHGVTLAGG